MVKSTVILASLATLLGLSSQTQMQINYYSDDHCTNYGGNLEVSWADDMNSGQSNCFHYNYGTSVNIANCWETYCTCLFYYRTGCDANGGYATAVYGLSNSGDCIQEAGFFNSFACYYSTV